MEEKKISVVLGSFNRLKFLKLTIQSIRKELKNFSYEIIVVDGGSSDGAIEWLISQKDIITIVQHNRGEWLGKKIKRKSWGYFMNLGFKCAKGKYICMISDDCLIIPGAIINGYKLFEKKLPKKEKIGAIAFYFRDWSVHKKYYVSIPFNKMFVNHGLYLKKALEEVNFIDEENYFFYGADADLCFKMLQKGYKCIASENSYIEHYPHANTQVRESNYNKEELYLVPLKKKWIKIFPEIENLNPNSILEKEFNDSNKTGNLFKTINTTPKFNTTPFWKKFYLKLCSKSKV